MTLTVRATDPPDPVHVSVNDEAAVIGALVSLPEVGLFPVHAPDAVQVVALVADHESCVELWLATAAGVAANVSVGEGAPPPPLTVTTAESAAVPPAPVQLSVKVEVALRDTLVSLPDVGLVPVQAPDATQAVAFVDDQVSCAEPGPTSELGVTSSVTVGAAGCAPTVTFTVSLTVPPAPVQANV